MNYNELIASIEKIVTDIPLTRSEGDGRLDSAKQEDFVLIELQKHLLEMYPELIITVMPPRSWCDIIIHDIPFNLKLSDCKSSDNCGSKPAICYSLTGRMDYPKSSNWNRFLEFIQESKKLGHIKKERNLVTEYHYLVKNKLTGEVLVKPIFDIHTYVSNSSNDLQIAWKNEFENRNYVAADYQKKIVELLICIQKSVRDMIHRSHVFANTDISELFK